MEEKIQGLIQKYLSDLLDHHDKEGKERQDLKKKLESGDE